MNKVHNSNTKQVKLPFCKCLADNEMLDAISIEMCFEFIFFYPVDHQSSLEDKWFQEKLESNRICW